MFKNAKFDLTYAWRLFLKSPGNSFLCIVVVALSVGLSLFVYVVVYNMALKPLPFSSAQNWLSLQVAESASVSQQPLIDAYTYQELRARSHSVDYVGAFSPQEDVLSEGQASNLLRGALISPGLLRAVNVAPLYGRIFDEGDSRIGASPTAILSYAAWQEYFAADPNIIGRKVRIDGSPVLVIGVMPKQFFLFQDFQVLSPLQFPVLANPADSTLKVTPVLTLQAGQTTASALNELQSVVAELNKNHPAAFNSGRQLALFPANRMYTHDSVPVIAMAGFIAIAVLLLGGMNISMIFFAMLVERSQELALRTALGSSRRSLLQQCLMQSMFVILCGLILGSILARLGIAWAHGLLDYSSRLMALGENPNELVMRPFDLCIAVAAAILLWLLSTLIPAWRISKLDPAATLASGGKGLAAHGKNRTTGILVGVQVAVSCMLLVICANIALAVNKELVKPLGVETQGRMISTYPTAFGARYADGNSRVRYLDQLENAILQRISGAKVAFMTAVPTAPNEVKASIESRVDGPNQDKLQFPVDSVSENYFDVLGIKLRSGRLFDSSDTAASQAVAVLDERTAAKYWPDSSPIGQRIRLDVDKASPWVTIIGIVSSVSGPYSETAGVVYRPIRQTLPDAYQLLVQFPSASVDGAKTLRAAAYEIDPDLPLHNLQMLDQYLTAINSYTSLVPGFLGIGLITVILAASGLFGLISRSVSQRTQEMGIYRALGSTKGRVIWSFLRQAMWYLVIGLVGGVLGILMTTSMSTAIPNALDSVAVVTFGVFALMAGVILGSSYLPARKAVAMEPGDALRYE